MTRILMMEGNTEARRARQHELGVRTSSAIYMKAVLAHFPDAQIDVVNGADPAPMGNLPQGRVLTDYDGLIISGSSLHAYDTDFAVTNQIALVAAAGEAGLPMFGSCWGLQIAVMAAGGRVIRNPAGREVGLARKICVNEVGAQHPMFAAKPPVFDALCIHYDEVVELPKGAVLLASNAHSRVQAAVIPVGKSEVWAVQYHPEFDLAHMVQIYRLYADDMIAQGFFADQAALDAYVGQLRALDAAPDNAGLSWQLGIDGDVLNPDIHHAEVVAWIRNLPS